ncbi:uncharacterized protein LOC110691060 [Chenopodium quinoa]|uniref:uncharacterized protein LOC110691060 n=1 Tax=Chenopodium quinoa TaxID=63459 RepID=UPI000B78E373|nr:uncharacterized protein LOC110691060 [Chenopodium quinoa]
MWPNDSSDKDWRGQWIWVRVPADPEHPHFFGAPRYLSRPDPNMQDLGPEDPDAARHPSYEQMSFFGKQKNPGGTGRMKFIPTRWLLDNHYVFQEKMLAVVGLSRKHIGELSEATSGIDYNRVGVNAKWVILDRAPAITAPKDRPLYLHSTGLQIEAAADYTKQKPWWEKRDPLRPLLPEEAQAAQTAEDVSRAISSLEGGVRTSSAAEQGLCCPPFLQSEEGSVRREGKAPARPEDSSSSEFEEMDEQPLAKRRRRIAVLGPRQFQTGLMPTGGIHIREPDEGRGSPRAPPPPKNPPPRTPPPPPETQEMEVDQKTPDPKGGVQGEDLNQGSAIGHFAEAAEKPTAEGFSGDIEREVDAFIRQPEAREEEEVIAVDPGRDQLGSAEGEKSVEPDKAQDAPSSSFPSFQSLNSGDLGFSAPRITIPEPVWERIWGQNREGAAGYFSDLTGMSEVDRARVWSLKATAGMGESSRRVPDPARDNQRLLMQTPSMTSWSMPGKMPRSPRKRQEKAKLAALKQQAAKEKQAVAEEYERQDAQALQTFCHAMETEVQEVEQRLEALESSRMAAEEAHQARDTQLSAAQADAEDQDQKLKGLEDQLKAKEDELAQAKVETSNVQLQLDEQKTSSSKLSEELEKSKKDLEESQKKLDDAEALLRVRLYTQEEYEMGYMNGFKVARRLALHAEPSLDWAKCTFWVQDPEDPHMKYPTPAEHEILQAEAAEEEAERRELKAEQRADDAQTRTQPASSTAGTETARGPGTADQPYPPAEA